MNGRWNTETRICTSRTCRTAAEAQLCLALSGDGCYGEETRGRLAAISAGQQWDPPGCAVEAWHDGELDDPAVPEILRKALEADAGRSCEAGSDPRRRDGVPDAEGEGQGPDFGIPNVGIRFLHMSG